MIVESFRPTLEDAFVLFSLTYTKQTGTSWTKEKFMSRARDWTFYGDNKGFVAVRVQRSGFVKMVGAAGNPKSILKGMKELQQENLPVWGMVSDKLVPMIVKLGFVRPPTWIIKTVFKYIPKHVFGNVNFTINSNGSITLQYADVGEATKYFVASRQYFSKLLTDEVDKIPFSSAVIKNTLVKAIQYLV